MKITIVCAGKIKEKYLRDGIAEYEKRLRPYADVRTHEIAEERMKEKPSAAEKAETIRREGERLLAQVPQGAYLIVLDVGGAELSSEALAAKIDRLAVTGESHIAFLIGGPIQEEVGWRGFALPILQERIRPLQAAVVLGIIWGGWHLPQFFVSAWETPHNNASDVLGFFAFTVTSSIVISWITNLARGSVLLAILAHNSMNWALATWSGITGQQATTIWPATAGMAVLAVVALIATRGRLGFGTLAESASAEPANG